MNKKIIWSLSIIAVLLVYLLAVNLRRSSDRIETPSWDGVADQILITWAGGSIKLLKKEGKWVAGDEAVPADAKKIDEIEKRFREVVLTDLVSKRGYYIKYDLTPDKYAEIIFKRGDATIRHFMIGKKSPTNRHTFIRIDDRPEIYLAEGIFDIVMNKSIEDFRDREIIRIEPGSVSSLAVEYLGRVFSFARKSDGEPAKGVKGAGPRWILNGNEAVTLDGGKIESLLASLNPLQAKSFPDYRRHALPRPLCIVRVESDRKEITVKIYLMRNEYLVESSESPYIFGTDKWNIEKFFITSIDQFKGQKEK
ncbi:MAG: DUF4340 domain-containing protein [Chrysiogenales bacterium]|nr:MAG: DUF4340 domain-containing protein [Chrysiogenales bacterium]